MRSMFILIVFIIQVICTSSATYDSVISSNSAGNLEHELSNNVVNGNVNRKFFIMRHGESVDRVFKTWITDSFNGETYLRKDLNMPKILPQRINQPQSWKMDPPLTYIGHYQAKLVGDAMKEHNIILDHVYSSPSYRSIQTCSAVLEGLGVKDKTSINIEPGLRKYLDWYIDGVQYCTTDALESVKININRNYEPFITLEEDFNVRLNETVVQFYDLSAALVEYFLKKHETGNILLVGHATTLDACTRKFLNKPKVTRFDKMWDIVKDMPYAAIIQLEQIDNVWQITKSPFNPITHSKNLVLKRSVSIMNIDSELN